ncbi:MAG: hypothetical protein WC860_00330 [Candidatus Margulisiibacteriota bacterium]|jgi:hypothetical protein
MESTLNVKGQNLTPGLSPAASSNLTESKKNNPETLKIASQNAAALCEQSLATLGVQPAKPTSAKVSSLVPSSPMPRLLKPSNFTSISIEEALRRLQEKKSISAATADTSTKAASSSASASTQPEAVKIERKEFEGLHFFGFARPTRKEMQNFNQLASDFGLPQNMIIYYPGSGPDDRLSAYFLHAEVYYVDADPKEIAAINTSESNRHVIQADAARFNLPENKKADLLFISNVGLQVISPTANTFDHKANLGLDNLRQGGLLVCNNRYKTAQDIHKHGDFEIAAIIRNDVIIKEHPEKYLEFSEQYYSITREGTRILSSQPSAVGVTERSNFLKENGDDYLYIFRKKS